MIVQPAFLVLVSEYASRCNQLARGCDQPYPGSRPTVCGEVRRDVTGHLQIKGTREVVYHTEFWPNLLPSPARQVYRLDFSPAMLRQTGRQGAPLLLAHSDAIHPGSDHWPFLGGAFRISRPGGAPAISGSDPHGTREAGYVEDGFDTGFEAGLCRFPSSRKDPAALKDGGFASVTGKTVEDDQSACAREEVRSDPFLQHSTPSQGPLPGAEREQAGLVRIPGARAERRVFRSETAIRAISNYQRKRT